jgi:hypothetical protein
MGFLLEAYSTHPPFDEILIDVRDSLGYQLKTSIPFFKTEDKEHLAAQVGFWVSYGGRNMIEKKKGMEGWNRLSPYHLCFSSSGTLCVSPFSVFSSELGGEEGGSEWKRWSSPEILSHSVEEANEKTVLFSLSLCLFSILSGEIPFSEVDGEGGGNLLLSHRRPSLSSLEGEKNEWREIISRLWDEEEGRNQGRE